MFYISIEQYNTISGFRFMDSLLQQLRSKIGYVFSCDKLNGAQN